MLAAKSLCLLGTVFLLTLLRGVTIAAQDATPASSEVTATVSTPAVSTPAVSTPAVSTPAVSTPAPSDEPKSLPVDSFQYMVAIRSKDTLVHLSAGALISRRVVLSTAHCLVGENPLKLIVFMSRLDRWDSDGLSFHVIHVKIHDKFDPGTLEYDLAIVYLIGSVPADHKFARPIALDRKPLDELSPPECVLSGFGQGERVTGSNFPLSSARVPFATQAVCQAKGTVSDKLLKSMMCAGKFSGDAGAEDTCTASDGGALVCREKLSGLVSRTPVGCPQAMGPAVFTKVSRHIRWIELNMAKRITYVRKNGSSKLSARLGSVVLAVAIGFSLR